MFFQTRKIVPLVVFFSSSFYPYSRDILFPFSCPTFDHLRRFRYIKMSSPHLNNLIIVGCMLTYSSVIFLGLDSQLSSVTAFPYICTARAWLLMAGFSLAFGSMFSKTWRVHSIFTDVKLNKKVSRSVRGLRFSSSRYACDRNVPYVFPLGDKGLPAVHGGWCIIGYRFGDYDDLAGCRSILPRNETNGALCKRNNIYPIYRGENMVHKKVRIA